MTSIILTFFVLNTDLMKNVRRRVRTEVVESEGPGVNQVVPVLNRLSVPDRSFDAFLVPALKLRPSLNCTKQETKELAILEP